MDPMRPIGGPLGPRVAFLLGGHASDRGRIAGHRRPVRRDFHRRKRRGASRRYARGRSLVHRRRSRDEAPHRQPEGKRRKATAADKRAHAVQWRIARERESEVKLHSMKSIVAAGLALLLGSAALLTTSCGKTTSAAVGPPPPPDVEVAKVEQNDIPIEREWIGSLDGLVNAAIKAEVTGYLLKQDYAEGSFV